MKLQRQFVLILVILALLAYVTWRICSERPWTWVQTFGLCVAVPAAALLATARFELGASFSIKPEARQLVTHGLYSKIRNPIYVFGAILVAGLFLLWSRPELYGLFAIIVPVQILRAHKEARVLEEKFGEEYRQYRAKTWF